MILAAFSGIVCRGHLEHSRGKREENQEKEDRPLHILLVEDDVRLARRLARVLTEERHTVEVVGDGKQAILRAQGGNFDCLILDILLPEMNGIAVCRWLRAHAITTAILLLTALDEIQDKVRGLDTGADDYLTKPFSFEELLARLRALERRNTSALQVTTQLQLGSLLLHLLTREVQMGAVRIDLTVREFALLEYLLRHAHHALTRTQILAAVWPSDTEVNTTIVDTYVHYVRTKIERYPDAPHVRTIRGIGYMLALPPREDEHSSPKKGAGVP
jgi:DNA-binding response OmpR family regulator